MVLGASFATVLAAAQVGAEWAVSAIYREYNAGLLRYLAARAGQDGEDVASATWLDVARALPSFDGDEERFRRWLYTIANRRLNDWLRRHYRRAEDAVSSDALPDSAAPEDPAEEVLAALAGDEAARRIASVLPAEHAEIVLLRVVGGFTVDEVAEITGRRAGSVRVMSHRALRRLAREIPGDV